MSALDLNNLAIEEIKKIKKGKQKKTQERV